MSILPGARINAADEGVLIEIYDWHGDVVFDIEAPTFTAQVTLDEEGAAKLQEWLAEYFARVRRADADA